MKPGDLALLDKEEIVLLLDILPARLVYPGNYDEDDEGRHIWLGGDDVIDSKALMGKVLWNGGAMWLELERLSPIIE